MAHDHMDFIEGVAREDIAALREKERTYRGSWKQRGGAGAFFMLARKWDRLENMLGAASHTFNESQVRQYDVFSHIEAQPAGEDGTVLAEVRDLRRYLLLVEAEMAARGVIRAGPPAEPIKEDYWLHGKKVQLDEMSTSGLRAQLIDLGRSPPSRVGDALAHDIRAELARRRAGASGFTWRGEPYWPGTPEDGGHHARQDIVPEGGACDMKVGDRVVCSTPGHTYYGRGGVAKGFLQDGDAYVQLDGESGHTMIKWNHLSKVP